MIPTVASPSDGRLHPRLPSLATLEYLKALATAALVLMLLALVAYFLFSDHEKALRIVAGRWNTP